MQIRSSSPHRPHTTTAVLGVILVCVQVCGLSMAFGLTIQRVDGAPCCCKPCPQDQELSEASEASSDQAVEAEAAAAGPAPLPAPLDSIALQTPPAPAGTAGVDRGAPPTASVPLLAQAPKTSPPSSYAAHA